MIIIKEKTNFSESDTTVKIDWSTFCKNLQSKIIPIKHIDVYPKSSTNFNITMDGRIDMQFYGGTVRFSLRGSSLSVISIGVNDILDIQEIHSKNLGIIFNLTLNNKMNCRIV